MPFKVFADLEPLTAAEMNDIQSQAVARFASTAARDAAIASPTAGQTIYVTGVGFQYWNGTAWTRLAPHRETQALGSTTASVTLSGIPSTLNTVRLSIHARCDTAGQYANLLVRVNGNSAASYRYGYAYVNGLSNATPIGSASATSISAGYTPGATTGAGIFSGTEITFHNWNAAGLLVCTFQGGFVDTTANALYANGVGVYTAGGPYTSITLLPAAGSFITGSQFALEGA